MTFVVDICARLCYNKDMARIDIHTHTTFSSDGISSPAEMIAAARDRDVTHYGISDHFDYDYRALHLTFGGKTLPDIDEKRYFSELRRLQTDLAERIPEFCLLIGGEFGFAPLARCYEEYAAVIETYRPDFVVNSVHTVGGHDCWFADYFADKSQERAYCEYLEAVRLSLDAPYSYDIVAHIGYVARNAPYEDRKLRYADYAAVLDDILRTIVAKGKILEVNTSSRKAGSAFLPDTDILTRYFELGGRKISVSSDAHNVSRVCEKFDDVVSALKQIGFTHLTVPNRGHEILIRI